MYVYININTHLCMNIYTHEEFLYIHIYIYVNVYMHIQTYTYIYKYTDICTYIQKIYINSHLYTHLCHSSNIGTYLPLLAPLPEHNNHPVNYLAHLEGRDSFSNLFENF
jgi:hypothetical protein